MLPSTQSNALIKKSKTDSQLMPPPPPPKRIKRPPKVLDEDTYTEALSEIIARDFFPGLHEAKCQQEYLDALESRDSDWIAEASRNLVAAQTPDLRRRGTSFTNKGGMETPRFGRNGSETPGGESVMSEAPPAKPKVNTNMSLDKFQATYTSEDNASFNDLLDEQNAKKRESYAWLWANNKNPSKQMVAQARVLASNPEKKLLEDAKHASDDRKALPETWKFNPRNSLMFHPDGPDSQPTAAPTTDPSGHEKLLPPKSILHANTRITLLAEAPSSSAPASPSLSAIHDAISGNPRRSASSLAGGSETPRVRGYSYIPSPSPSDLARTAASIPTLPEVDKISTPFRIAATPRRELLHQKMVDKVNKTKRLNKGASTPSITTPLHRGGAKTPSMTPAGQRLWSQMTKGGKGFGDAFGSSLTPRADGARGRWTPTPKRSVEGTPKR